MEEAEDHLATKVDNTAQETNATAQEGETSTPSFEPIDFSAHLSGEVLEWKDLAEPSLLWGRSNPLTIRLFNSHDKQSMNFFGISGQLQGKSKDKKKVIAAQLPLQRHYGVVGPNSSQQVTFSPKPEVEPGHVYELELFAEMLDLLSMSLHRHSVGKFTLKVVDPQPWWSYYLDGRAFFLYFVLAFLVVLFVPPLRRQAMSLFAKEKPKKFVVSQPQGKDEWLPENVRRRENHKKATQTKQ